jgi:hypothetical protein
VNHRFHTKITEIDEAHFEKVRGWRGGQRAPWHRSYGLSRKFLSVGFVVGLGLLRVNKYRQRDAGRAPAAGVGRVNSAGDGSV